MKWLLARVKRHIGALVLALTMVAYAIIRNSWSEAVCIFAAGLFGIWLGGALRKKTDQAGQMNARQK